MTRRIFFMGTPQFSVHSLEALEKIEGISVVGVSCQPDKPKGRGQKFQPCPVKEQALSLGYPIFQPKTLKKGHPDGDQFFEAFKALKPDLCVVTAYGRIIPKRFLNWPQFGFVNVHASLLPRWRGAAPIQRAIEAGDKETGIAIMDMIYELDAGDVYRTYPLPIQHDDDTPSLSLKLAQLSQQALIETIPDILNKKITPTPQPNEGLIYAHMLSKSEGEISFDLSATELYRKAKAFTPWPGLYCHFRNQLLKCHEPYLVAGESSRPNLSIGTFIRYQKELHIQTYDGRIGFRAYQPAGKKRLDAETFMNGYQIRDGEALVGANSTTSQK